MAEIIIKIPHPSTYMADVFRKAIEEKHERINFAEDELIYVLSCIEKLQKIEKILNECADWYDDTCHALKRIEQIVKEVE